MSCKLSSAELGICMGKVLGAGESMCMLHELNVGWNDFDDIAMQVLLRICQNISLLRCMVCI